MGPAIDANSPAVLLFKRQSPERRWDARGLKAFAGCRYALNRSMTPCATSISSSPSGWSSVPAWINA